MKLQLAIPENLEHIVKDIHGNGGKAYLVGGAVIDSLQGRQMKDWDVEVYRLSLNDLASLLSKYGTSKTVGESFGVTKLNMGGEDYDFSLPRRENRIGKGHKDFDVELVPDMTLEEAGSRRDLTINSMSLDLENGTLYDPFNGLADLDIGRMRHTSDKFAEDPLRVLRLMQLLPRKGRFVDPETMELCRSLVNEFQYLKKERVYEEWNKLLLKANKPSIGLDFLVDCDWMRHFPELDVLRLTDQRLDWHPEGNVYNHTKMVLDCGAKLKQHIPEDWQLPFMYGLLLHDVGKAVTTSDELTSIGHDTAGVPIAERFMRRITDENRLNELVKDVVRYHMMPGNLYRGEAKEATWKRLHNKIRLDVIGYVSKADSSGRGGYSLEQPHPPSEIALGFCEKYGPQPISRLVSGDNLKARGYRQGLELGAELKRLYEVQLEENITDKDKLLQRINSRI